MTEIEIKQLNATDKVTTTKGKREYQLVVKLVKNEKSKNQYLVLENTIDGKKRGRFILPIGLRKKTIEILKDITKEPKTKKHFKNSKEFQEHLAKLNEKQKQEALQKLAQGEITIGE